MEIEVDGRGRPGLCCTIHTRHSTAQHSSCCLLRRWELGQEEEEEEEEDYIGVGWLERARKAIPPLLHLLA